MSTPHAPTFWDGQPITVDSGEILAVVRGILADAAGDGKGREITLSVRIPPATATSTTVELDGLEKLGTEIAPYIPSLIVFYLVGCYLPESGSLRGVARALLRLHQVHPLPEPLPVAHPMLSKIISRLSSDVFDKYFGRSGSRLLANGPGQSAELSEYGRRAWELARTYLGRNNLLPVCADGSFERELGAKT